MTQSFDDFYEENKDVFDPCVWRSAEKAFQAGAQSKQAEIDELRKQLDLINQYTAAQGEVVKIANDERLELRKRIDEAVLALEKKSTGLKGLVDNYNKSLNILKGTINEQ